MKNDYTEDLCRFLAKRENFADALEIAELIEPVKQRFQVAFWKKMAARFRQKIRRCHLSRKWTVDVDDDEYLGSSGYGIELNPAANQDDRQCLYYFLIYEDWKGHHISEALSWCLQPSNAVQKRAAELRQDLDDKCDRSNKWSIAWKSTREFQSQKDFVLELASHTDQLAKKVFETAWDFFAATHQRVEQINASFHKKRSG